MKYISRFAALLMALMMVVGNAGAEMPLDGLTQNELDWLYLAASDAEDMYLTGVLGVTEPFNSSDAEAWQNLGYALQWYVIDTNGERIALPGETGTSINITYTMTEQRFVCVATDEQGEELSPVYVVQAQTEVMEDYLDILYNDYEELYYIPEAPIDAYAAAAWQWMQTWNVTLADGSNLAEKVLDAWLAERTEEYFEPQLLCSCVVDGLAEASTPVLHPSAQHAESCGWYRSVTEVKNAEPGVTVSGQFPADVTLLASKATLEDVLARLNGAQITAESVPLVGIEHREHLVLDLSMMQEGSEYQPEQEVWVTVDPEELWLEAGDQYLVYHVHQDASGAYTVSLLPVGTSVNGEASFALDGFSYVIVVNGTQTITGVKDFYSATGQSTNGHVAAVGIYVLENGDTHVLLSCKANAADYIAEKLAFDGAPLAPVGEDATTNYGTVTQMVLKDENDEEIEQLFSSGGGGGKEHTCIKDMMVGRPESITEEFKLEVEWLRGGGFNFTGDDALYASVILKYQMQKTVHSVNGVTPFDQESATVQLGDTVVFQTVVTNSNDSTINIEEGRIEDTLPPGLLAEGNIQVSIGGKVWSPGNVVDNVVVIEPINVPRDESVTYYIRGVVSAKAVGTYTNTAYITGGNVTIPSTDTADVVIKEIVPPAIAITKLVNGVETGEKQFKFTVTGPGYNNDTVELKDGGSVVLTENLTAGTYTITEIPVEIPNYTLTSVEVNGTKLDDVNNSYSYTVDVTAESKVPVVFTNTYEPVVNNSSLTIKKEGMTGSESAIVKVTANSEVYMLVLNEDNPQAVIDDLPIDSTYTVEELTGWSWRYTASEPHSVEGTIQANATQNVVTLTNTPKTDQWLHDESYVINNFGSGSKDESNNN